jgi:uncharacterized protein
VTKREDPGTRRDPDSYQGPIIDACAYHIWPTQQALTSYMSRGWREYVSPTAEYTLPILPILQPYTHPDGGKLASAYPLEGPPGSDYAVLREQVLEAANVERVILSLEAAVDVQTHPNHHLAREIARAANDWCVENWLDRGDERMSSLVLVANQLPVESAIEIRRIGHHPGMAGVLMAGNGIGVGFGHPLYHPIYEAAVELGLPIVIQTGGDSSPNRFTHHTAGGIPATYGEYRVLMSQSVSSHLVSLIGQGVFETYPELKVLVVGAGASWLSALLWRLESKYTAHGREVPGLHHRPSDYLHDHVRVTTYPANVEADGRSLLSLLDATPGVEDMLCFASGYPNWDADISRDIVDTLPKEWHSKVFYENAHSLFRWPEAKRRRTLNEEKRGN